MNVIWSEKAAETVRDIAAYILGSSAKKQKPNF